MSKPLRFDADAGRLIGSTLPSVAELIEGARANGMRFVRGVYWQYSNNCGCAQGVINKLAGRHPGHPIPGFAHYGSLTSGFDGFRRSYLNAEVYAYGIAVRLAAESAGLMVDA